MFIVYILHVYCYKALHLFLVIILNHLLLFHSHTLFQRLYEKDEQLAYKLIYSLLQNTTYILVKKYSECICGTSNLYDMCYMNNNSSIKVPCIALNSCLYHNCKMCRLGNLSYMPIFINELIIHIYDQHSAISVIYIILVSIDWTILYIILYLLIVLLCFDCCIGKPLSLFIPLIPPCVNKVNLTLVHISFQMNNTQHVCTRIVVINYTITMHAIFMRQTIISINKYTVIQIDIFVKFVNYSLSYMNFGVPITLIYFCNYLIIAKKHLLFYNMYIFIDNYNNNFSNCFFIIIISRSCAKLICMIVIIRCTI